MEHGDEEIKCKGGEIKCGDGEMKDRTLFPPCFAVQDFLILICGDGETKWRDGEIN